LKYGLKYSILGCSEPFSIESLMKQVFFHQPLILAVRNAVWQNAYEGGNVYFYEKVTEVLTKTYPVKTYGIEEAEWETKLKSVLNSLKNKSVNTDVSGTYYTFSLLCDYLGIKINPRKTEQAEGTRYEYDLRFSDILEELYNETIIDQKIYEEQKRLLAEKGFGDSQLNFTMFYSRGRETPGMANLEIDLKKETARLRYLSDKSKKYSGKPSYVNNNLSVHFTNSRNENEAFLTLTCDTEGGIEKALRLTGLYVSADIHDNNEPISVRVIATKIKSPGRDAILQVPETIALELHNKRLNRNQNSVNPQVLQNVKGSYVGYWFAVRKNVKVIKCTLIINANGSCTLHGAHSQTSEGAIVETNESAGVLRCELSYTSSKWQNNLQMLFDLQTIKKRFIDGVYQGMEPHQHQIMAGRIRFYKLSENEKLPDPEAFLLSELSEKVPDKAEELTNFFWGIPRETPTSRFLQPNHWTFTHLYGQAEENGHETALHINDFNCDFLMFKRDSKRRKINQYPMRIQDGKVNYTLDLDGGRSYSGTAVFISNCLILKVTKRDQKPYQALYLFYVGIRFSSENLYINGVYATYSHSGSPVCGRAVLKVNGKSNDYKPIEIDNDAFQDLDSENGGALNFLAGIENNLIKTGKTYDLYRETDYGPVFFQAACNSSFNDFERARILKYAFDNGFNSYEQLMEGVTGGLKSIFESKILRITAVKDDPTRHLVTILYGRHQKKYFALAATE